MVGSGTALTYGSTYKVSNWAYSTTSNSTGCSDWWDDSTASAAYAWTSAKAAMNNMVKYASPKYIMSVPNSMSGDITLNAGQRTVNLPDGSKLLIDDAGNYRIEDNDAKVTYRANRVREFSPHLNASDMLAQFVKYVGSLGVQQAEVLGLPIELFINWLIIEAAERDHDAVPPDVVPVFEHREVQLILRPKCLSCGRFIPRLHRQHRFPFCGVEHAARYVSLQSHKPLALQAT